MRKRASLIAGLLAISTAVAFTLLSSPSGAESEPADQNPLAKEYETRTASMKAFRSSLDDWIDTQMSLGCTAAASCQRSTVFLDRQPMTPHSLAGYLQRESIGGHFSGIDRSTLRRAAANAVTDYLLTVAAREAGMTVEPSMLNPLVEEQLESFRSLTGRDNVRNMAGRYASVDPTRETLAKGIEARIIRQRMADQVMGKGTSAETRARLQSWLAKTLLTRHVEGTGLLAGVTSTELVSLV